MAIATLAREWHEKLGAAKERYESEQDRCKAENLSAWWGGLRRSLKAMNDKHTQDRDVEDDVLSSRGSGMR